MVTILLRCILTFASLVVLVGFVSGCSQARIPTDAEVRQSFIGHRAEFEDVKTRLLAEKAEGFRIYNDASVGYLDEGKDPHLSPDTVGACLKLMKEVGCAEVHAVTHKTILFRVGIIDDSEKLEQKYILYNKDKFESPQFGGLTGDSTKTEFVQLEPQWRIEHRLEKKKFG